MCLGERVILFYLILKIFIYLILERGEGRKRGRETLMWERNISWLSIVHALTGSQSHNLDMCSDLESNLQPFTLQTNALSTEPQPSEQKGIISIRKVLKNGNVCMNLHFII